MQIIHTSVEQNKIFLMNFIGKLFENSDVEALKSDIPFVSKEIRKFYNDQGKKIRVLIDLSQFKADYMIEATRALTELAKEDKDIVDRTAVYGGEKKLKIFGETIVMLSGRKNIKFFDSKDDALKWLEDSPN